MQFEYFESRSLHIEYIKFHFTILPNDTVHAIHFVRLIRKLFSQFVSIGRQQFFVCMKCSNVSENRWLNLPILFGGTFVLNFLLLPLSSKTFLCCYQLLRIYAQSDMRSLASQITDCFNIMHI